MSAASLSPKHLEKVRSSGWNDETIALWGLRTITDPGEIAKIRRVGYSQKSLGACLAFPLAVPGRGHVLTRLRPDRPKPNRKTGKAPKYLSPSGVPLVPIFPPRSVRDGRLTDARQPLYITEGELKTGLLDQLGYAAIGGCGCDVFHIKQTDDEKPHSVFRSELRDFVTWPLREVVLVFDADGVVNENVQRGESRLAFMAHEAGADTIRVVRIPHGEGLPKGIDDYFVAHGEEATRALLASGETITVFRDPATQKTGAAPKRGESLTQLGAAERLVDGFADDLRFVWAGSAKGKPEATRVLAWDGRRWVEDRVGRSIEMAERALRSWYTDLARARQVGTREADDWADDIEKFIRRHERANELAGIVTLASADPKVKLTADALDADPFLLNCRNGTVNLRTGELIPHRREDMNTRLCNADYRPEARSERWEAFLLEAMAGDVDQVAYLQRMAGRFLLGSRPGDHRLFFLYGEGGTGKGTFANTLRRILGEYAAGSNGDSFTEGTFEKSANEHRSDLVRILTRRLVVVSELKRKRRWDSELLKKISGGDPVAAREIHRAEIEFTPSCDLLFMANHRPLVDADDTGFWRRIVEIDFNVTPAKKDEQLGERFVTDPAEAAGILAWAVRGTALYLESGLPTTKRIEEARAAYRQDVDDFGAFFETYCFWDGSGQAVTSRKELRDAYNQAADENGWTPLDARSQGATKVFVEAVRKRLHGVLPANVNAETRKRVGGRTPLEAWRGVRLLTDIERAAQRARLRSVECSDVVTCSGQFGGSVTSARAHVSGPEISSLQVTTSLQAPPGLSSGPGNVVTRSDHFAGPPASPQMPAHGPESSPLHVTTPQPPRLAATGTDDGSVWPIEEYF